MIRADFAMHENYIHQPGARLRSDVVAFGGLRDSEAGRIGLNAWRDVTDGSFALRMLPGDHFFIQSAPNVFLRTLSIELNQVLDGLFETAPAVWAAQ
jgi:medium-chain acyl-[acyl-carrier-protein] hydrolase